MVCSVPILKHKTFFLQESTQNERIQLVPIDLGILCHNVPIYSTACTGYLPGPSRLLIFLRSVRPSIDSPNVPPHTPETEVLPSGVIPRQKVSDMVFFSAHSQKHANSFTKHFGILWNIFDKPPCCFVIISKLLRNMPF